jgi:hypothetical protein
MASSAQIAANFIDRYGPDRLRWLLDAFARGESGQAIADELGVSRERVRYWRNTFGASITVYRVHTEVEQALDRG